MSLLGELAKTATTVTSAASTAPPPATTVTGTTSVARGWECPRCQRINAPHASQCTCYPGMQFVPYGLPVVPTYPTAWPAHPDGWYRPQFTFSTCGMPLGVALNNACAGAGALPDNTVCAGTIYGPWGGGSGL